MNNNNEQQPPKIDLSKIEFFISPVDGSIVIATLGPDGQPDNIHECTNVVVNATAHMMIQRNIACIDITGDDNEQYRMSMIPMSVVNEMLHGSGPVDDNGAPIDKSKLN